MINHQVDAHSNARELKYELMTKTLAKAILGHVSVL